jgi:hypothetical protein
MKLSDRHLYVIGRHLALMAMADLRQDPYEDVGVVLLMVASCSRALRFEPRLSEIRYQSS